MTLRVHHAAILAGGASARMGRDKASLPLAQVPMIEWVEAAARSAGYRTLRVERDIGGNRGPLSGLLTVFENHPWDSFLALSCDMPLIPATWLRALGEEALDETRWGVFTKQSRWVGFPFTVHRSALKTLRECLASDRATLQNLRRRGQFIDRAPPSPSGPLFGNVNTIDDWTLIEEFVRQSGTRPAA